MKTELEITCRSIDDLPAAAKAILDFAGNTRLFLVYAPMGAGKTTLIKEFCKQLGSKDHFSSPTYAIINEYACPSGKIFHFDLYRLKNEEELMDLGVEDYITGKEYCFFEWPELVEPLIDESYIKIEIEVNDNIRYLRAWQF
jgi:tRNA threonylcarbamoyladenosine biosynthesis protein TsaE